MQESRIGLLAGAGKLPVEFLKSARERGEAVITFALEGITNPEVEELSDEVVWIKPFKLGKFFKEVERRRPAKFFLLGKVEHKAAVDLKGLDLKAISFLMKLKDRKPQTIIIGIIEELEKRGVKVANPESYLKRLLLTKGEVIGKPPSEEVLEDLKFGMEIAKEIASLDIGQTVVVKNKTVIAVEGIEGTDECIKRGAALAGKGFVVCKAARREQDMRVDVPTVGIKTVELIETLGGKGLAVEAGKTYLLDRERVETGKIPVLAL
ncbi:LpxI family protein [Thermovibrio ammonificans]